MPYFLHYTFVIILTFTANMTVRIRLAERFTAPAGSLESTDRGLILLYIKNTASMYTYTVLTFIFF
jgi:hypothetical protein